MNDLKTLANPFQFTDLQIRTAIDAKNDVWFCAKDVCQVLDISWSGRGNTLRSIPKTWVMVSYYETIQGDKETIFINEPALYKMIFRSNKPKAEEFANWVCEEVLPQIRKQGYFGQVSPKDYIAIVKQIAVLSQQLMDSKNAFLHSILQKPLRNLCNMAGHPMPDIQLIAKTLDQVDIFDKQAK